MTIIYGDTSRVAISWSSHHLHGKRASRHKYKTCFVAPGDFDADRHSVITQLHWTHSQERLKEHGIIQ